MAKIVFLGGGEREQILKNALNLDHEVITINSTEEILANINSIEDSKVFIAPLSSTDQDGVIRESRDLSLLLVMEYIPCKAVLMIGAAKDIIKRKAEQKLITVVELGDYDELAWLNAIPTAEGTIRALMDNIDTTIDGANFLILGAGRVALTLAVRLKALGADVLIAARKTDQINRAYALMLKATELSQVSGKFDAIINTVPAAFIDKKFFEKNNTRSYVELASVSGLIGPLDGTIAYLPLPGIPGKYAPKKAGFYLANTVPALIDKLLKVEEI